MEKQGFIASKVQDFLVWAVIKYLWIPSSLGMNFGKRSYEEGYLWFSLVFLIFILLQTWDKLFFGNVDFGFLYSHSRLSFDPLNSKSRVYFKDIGSIRGMIMCTTDDDDHGLSLRAIEGLRGNLARFCDFSGRAGGTVMASFAGLLYRLLRFCGQPVPPSDSFSSCLRIF
ncbi:hypothetical protein MA16_Dca013596 [Dendrobium catenatum]|uniref:Uncharacterized protein n=1 Tax=Dendrobium catenatum TaxID=906689 RepID=A0A2I0VUS3_9ASPA|nr:hypothetical protein MA16_Dca013596 [Dendrobium catenatum]